MKNKVITKESISNEEFVRMMELTLILDEFFNKKTTTIELMEYLYGDLIPLIPVKIDQDD